MIKIYISNITRDTQEYHHNFFHTNWVTELKNKTKAVMVISNTKTRIQ